MPKRGSPDLTRTKITINPSQRIIFKVCENITMTKNLKSPPVLPFPIGKKKIRSAFTGAVI